MVTFSPSAIRKSFLTSAISLAAWIGIHGLPARAAFHGNPDGLATIVSRVSVGTAFRYDVVHGALPTDLKVGPYSGAVYSAPVGSTTLNLY